MPTVLEFDSRTVHPPANPATDTKGTVNFPKAFVANPRLPHGFRELDIDKNSNIRAKSTIESLTKNSVECHVSTWSNTTLYSSIETVFALAPANVEFQTGEVMRNANDPASVRVNFARPYPTPPKVVTFFNYLDLDQNHGWRLKITPAEIDEKGFTLKIETWGETVFFGAQAAWIAYPEDRKHIFSASVNVQDVRDWQKPQLQQSKAISFGDVEFWKNPEVFIALNALDINKQANLRLRAYVDGVSKTGLTWHIDGWSDTVLNSAGASIIAFNN
ncbi:hypothetical protein CPB83DRAFT_819776 [Crepidotus variabilis]|uniref:H-type lectin domain-containing protein n=1 Tax=Crepidotus variabilis TaxID=179855 RepID=A0A9P6E8W1_9AGAR|nr:hypothetical protein CPB83DRAFT_819776 [Crepidotus variabilis]